MTVVSSIGWIERKSRATACLLARERSVATVGFNRWLVPPAALCLHLCIGMSYGLSVFWLPLSRAIGIDKPVACSNQSLIADLFTTTCDWQVSNLLIIFTTGVAMLGFSAAIFGEWVERSGPRKTGAIAACCWGGGFAIASFGICVHQLWIVWIGLGIVGGIGLGLGYIAPVSVLVNWFPDRRGMATGVAIMGFGGGAMIGAPLADLLINTFKSPTSIGVEQAFLVLGAIYLALMLIGAFACRIPPIGWQPEGWTPTIPAGALISTNSVDIESTHNIPQFWLLWILLCMNVSAGIGVLAMASPMLQEIFGGALIGKPNVGLAALDATERGAVASIGAGFVGLLSLFNIGGRLFWAALSDHIGRRNTFHLFFILGILLYASVPSFAHMGSRLMFVGALCLIITIYGGGFATMPAYLADLFGPQFVGGIHGRLLTAWSTAGLAGPLLVSYVRDVQLRAGVDRVLVYDRTMYILSGLLVLGLIANILIGPIADKWHLARDEAPRSQAESAGSETAIKHDTFGIGRGGLEPKVVMYWLLVCLPLGWGMATTLQNAIKIF